MEVTVVDDSNLYEIEDYVYKRVYDESLIYYGKQKYVDDLDIKLNLHVKINAASEKECKSLNSQAEAAICAGEQRGLEDAEKASNAFEISASNCDYSLITDNPKSSGNSISKTYLTMHICTNNLDEKEYRVRYLPLRWDKKNKKMWASAAGRESKSMKNVYIDDSVWAFLFDSELCKVTRIDDSAFSNMKKLTQATIGSNVTTIGKKAFYGDSKLKEIIIESKRLKTIEKNAFKGISKKAVFLVPDGKTAEYKKMLIKSGAPKTIKVKSEKTVIRAEYKSRVRKFTKDKRWRNGISWYGHSPKLSQYHQASDCAAYAADFTQYVFGRPDPEESRIKYRSVRKIKSGDVLHIENKYSDHWICVLERRGNKLRVAEGNYSRRVRIGWNYQISGNSIVSNGVKNKLIHGYRMNY